jgi:transcription factor C subunit 3
MKYPPADIVAYIIKKTAYSGNDGITLFQMWRELGQHMGGPIDSFMKHIIWQWLFSVNRPTAQSADADDRDDEVFVYKFGLNVPLPVYGPYAEYLKANVTDTDDGEAHLVLKPGINTQWKYLTGSCLKKAKLQLGEFPFQLLCEIAKNGASGVLSPDLSKNTGQDPRSLTPRLKKLEDMNYIVKTGYYNEKSKQHTSLSIHREFVKGNVSSAIADLNEDLGSSRNVAKTKQYIVDAVKAAPNKLRGFRDLKVELKLDKSKSLTKFFRSIVENLDKRGFVERLMVKEADDMPLVYCIRYVQDLSSDFQDAGDDLADILDDDNKTNQTRTDVDHEDDDEDMLHPDASSGTDRIPSISKVFPLQNQIYQHILSRSTAGATSMEIVRALTGVSDCRPYTKTLDAITSFAIDHDKVKKLRKYGDVYEKYSIVRGYDFEGKYKFYRYFTKDNYASISYHDKTNAITKRPPRPQAIEDLNKKLYVPLGRITQATLLGVGKRKIAEVDSTNDPLEPPRKERRGRPRKDANKAPTDLQLKSAVERKTKAKAANEDAVASELNIAGVSTQLVDVAMPHDGVLDDAAEVTESDAKVAEAAVKAVTLAKRSPRVADKFSPVIVTGSLKAIKRRTALIEIIRDQGGVTYTAANLCRMVDERLGNSTITDKKTLARDVSFLIANKDLQAEDVTISRSGQQVSRKLLILTNPASRPSPARIERAKRECMNDIGNKQGNTLERRVIEDQVTLFNSAPSKKSKRLASLKGKENAKVKQEQREEVASVTAATADSKKKSKKGSKRSKREEIDEEAKKNPGKNGAKDIGDNDDAKFSFRVRSDNKFDQEQATLLYRAVIISRSFNRGPIDFESITRFFPGMSVSEIKRKWISVRKVAGGLPAVLRGIRVFEKIVSRAIEDGLVSSGDLAEVDYEFFLSTWEDADNSILADIDSSPIYSNMDDNLRDYEFPQSRVAHVDLFDQLEDNSMRQKEAILSATTFFYDSHHTEMTSKSLDRLKTILKATFATQEAKFTKISVNNTLAEYGEKDTEEAIAALIRAKEVSYHTLQDSDARFILTDKFHTALMQKVFNLRFFKQAAQFEHNFKTVVEAKKGLILSQGISGAEMAALMDLLMHKLARLTRVDKPYRFSGYESRLIDRSKLSCDLILSGPQNLAADTVVKVAVPTGKACSRIWIDLNGGINGDLWVKIVIAVLYQIVFKPGVTRSHLHLKLHVAMSVDDLNEVLKWLEQSRVMRTGSCGGLYAVNEWFAILGE